MRSAAWCLLLFGAVAACDVARESETAVADPANGTPPPAAEADERYPLHAFEAQCFPATTAALDGATKALAAKEGLKGEAIVRDAEAPWRAELAKTTCPGEVSERVRVRRLALRHAALRMQGTDDAEILLDLGSESFATTSCKEALAATCTDALAWFEGHFPDFVDGTTIAIRPMDRLPITPQPGGRLTVEYMETLENRLAMLRGEAFALVLSPTVRIDAPSAVELRVDGADVNDEREHKAGAHVVVALPPSDLVRAQPGAPVVVVVLKKELHRAGSTWRANARVAYSML